MLVVCEGPEKIGLFHRHYKKPVVFFGNLMKGPQSVDVRRGEAGEYCALRFLDDML